jgi:glyoxalase/bleomycin resistance protein/dioxygenase superfamily protein
MRRLLLAILVTAAVSPGAAQAPPVFRFHHLHLNDDKPPFLLEFYERLFAPASTARVTEGESGGLRSGPMLLLIGKGGLERQEPTALWHFGWGGVSLGETYLAHARQEVAWEPPLPAGQLHFHLRSVTPSAAALWYREVLGARAEIAPETHGALPPPEHRIPEALVWLDDVGLLIYRTQSPLFSTRGHRADHIALACENLDRTLDRLRRRGVAVTDEPAIRGRWRTAIVEGPDRLAIELVEAP